MTFICINCRKKYTDDLSHWQCECGGYLQLEKEVTFKKEDINYSLPGMWRYEKAFPLSYKNLKSTYNEGMTPLVPMRNSEYNIFVKMESLMPTGSFKDRGSVMVVNYLINQGVKRITEDSSGNAGASVAGYCALANVPCDIYVPKNTSYGKLVQIVSYGASIHKIDGTRENVAEAAQIDSQNYAGHNWHPMFIEGTKSLAYEIWEQNNFKSPDNIVSVSGNGSTIMGLYHGFKTLLNSKQIERMPRLYAVQSENCNPIYRKYKKLSKKKTYKSTIAEGIALANPNKIDQIIEAIEETNGTILISTEEEIKIALKDVISQGFYMEPTSATAYAGLKQLINNKSISKEQTTILMASGNGLKANIEIEELLK